MLWSIPLSIGVHPSIHPFIHLLTMQWATSSLCSGHWKTKREFPLCVSLAPGPTHSLWPSARVEFSKIPWLEWRRDV